MKRPDLVQYISLSHGQNPGALMKLSVSSNKKILWTCPECHMEHNMVVNSVTRYAQGSFPCKVRAKKEIITGVNDLAHLEKEVMLDWDHELNTLDPNTIAPGDSSPAYWICKTCGYKWKTEHIYERTGKIKHGCPQCYKRQRKEREQIQHASFIVHYLRAIGSNPGSTARSLSEQMGTTSGATQTMLKRMMGEDLISRRHLEDSGLRKAAPYGYWLTPEGDKRLDELAGLSGNIVPIRDVSRKPPVKGVNDLVTWCQEKGRIDLISEWDSEKNDSPEIHAPGDDYVAGWICSVCGNKWNTPVKSRTFLKKWCPECRKRSSKVAEIRVLKCIAENPSISTSEISDSTKISLANLSKMLNSIVDNGLADREIRIVKGHRGKHYTLTEKGQKEIVLIEMAQSKLKLRTTDLSPNSIE